MNNWHREMAEDIIRSHVEDIEFGVVGEALREGEDVQGMTHDECSNHQRAIHDLILAAQITITWPEA